MLQPVFDFNLYWIYIFWASLSYFYAINPTEVIVNITRQANVLLILNTFILSKKKNNLFNKN